MRFASSVLVWQLLIGCHAAPSPAPAAPATSSPSAPSAPTSTPGTPATATVAVPATATATAAATATAPATATEPPAQPSPFVVRYVCDDKYDEGSVCRPGKPEWDAWLAGVRLSTTSPNLLELHGGGPSGAEWNPNAPLVVFVASTEAGRARLKAGKLTLTPVARFGDYDVFLVAFKAWRAAVRPARPSDFRGREESVEVAPLSVVELRALGPQGELAHGWFAFAEGE